MKKSSIILSLLTLTAALASLPALGELTYLKKNTPYIEKIPIEKISSSVSNPHAPIEKLLDDNKNTEWISWQESWILTENYSEHKDFSNISVDNLYTKSITNGDRVLKVSAIEPTPDGQEGYRKWRQYRLFDNLQNLSQDIKYRLQLRYRGNIAANDAVRVFLGQFSPQGETEKQNGSIHLLDVPTEWTIAEFEFNKLPKNIDNGFCCMQPQTYPGILEVDWAVLSYFDENAETQPLYTYDYTSDNYSTETNPCTGGDSGNVSIVNDNTEGKFLVSKFNGGWFQFPITADLPTLNLQPKTTYKVEIEMKGEKEGKSIRWWVGDKSSYAEYSTKYDLNYGTDWGTSILTFSTPENVPNDKPAVIKIQPGGDPGKIQIKSVKIFEYPKLGTNEGSPLFSDDNDENRKYTQVKDGVIYSNPLADRRKIIVSFGTPSEGEPLKYQKDHKYAVSYNLKYSVNGTVQAELHKTGGENPDDNIIGESEETKIIAGSTQQIRSVAYAGEDVNYSPAVVLDLGYNVGDVEVSNLRVYDITTDVAAQNDVPNPKVNKAEQQDFTRNMTTQQITVMEGLKFEAGTTYTVTVRMKSTEDGRLCLKLGDYQPDSKYRSLSYKNFAKSPDTWQDVIFENVTAPADVSTDNPGTLTLQLQTQNGIGGGDTSTNGVDNYEGEVTIQVVKVLPSNWVEEVISSMDYTNVNEYPYGTYDHGTGAYPRIKDGKLIVKDYIANGWNGNDIFDLKDGFSNIDLAKTFRFFATSKGTLQTDLRVRFGRDGAMIIGNLPVNTVLGETYVDLKDGQPYQIAPDGKLMLQTFSTIGDIEIEKWRLVTNKNERVVWFTNGLGTATGLNSYGDTYNNYKITNEGLVLNPQYNTQIIVEKDENNDNIPLTWGKQYPVSFDIKAPAGDYVVSLGDGDVKDSKVITVPGGVKPDADGFVHKELVFNSVPADNGKLTITPNQYAGTIYIKNVSISEGSPAISQGDMIGTDFFKVELKDGYTMKKDGDYFFHIGYVPFGDGLSNCTPKKFLIQGSTNDTDFTNIGTYEVQDWDNGNAHIGSVNNPVRNIPEGTKYLRFYCMENEGDDYTTAVCFPQDDFDSKTNGYVGKMMRLTRFAIYRQDEITDPQGATTSTWALPLLTRFQIEANGKKYAYPGARLRDMIGIHKAYTNTSELFGVDTRDITNGYWDTTLPYNIQMVEEKRK